MVAVRFLALAAVAAVVAGCADGARAPASPGMVAGGHFARLAWTSRAAPPARLTPAMAFYPPGRKVVLFGGEALYRHASGGRALGDTWVFGIHGWRRVFPRHSPPPRVGGLLAYDPVTRRLLLFGGSSARGQYSKVLSDSWTWNGTDWTRLRRVRLPTWMGGTPAAAYDPVAGRITELAPGPGYPGSDPARETFSDGAGSGRAGRWLWTGRSWSFHAAHPAPGIFGGALAHDPLSGAMVYFAGTPDTVDDPAPPDPAGTRYSQTWLWHDGQFTRQSPSRAPAGPVLMAGDPRIGRVVAIDTAGRLWAWTTTTWQPLASGRGPQAGAAAAYDPALGDLVVFGTQASTTSPTRQTWLWNGKRWITGPFTSTPHRDPRARASGAAMRGRVSGTGQRVRSGRQYCRRGRRGPRRESSTR